MAETLHCSASNMEQERIQVSDSGTKSDSMKKGVTRAEIDTSAPFESVKDAVSRFGGIGYWKPSQRNLSEAEHEMDEVDIAKVEEQASKLEKETLEVLKELETTKMMVDELKSKTQKEASEVNVKLKSNADDKNGTHVANEAKQENHEIIEGVHQNSMGSLYTLPSSAPVAILMELKEAKLNLSRTTSDLADIRTSVESLNKKLEKERISLEKTRERLSLNSSKVSSLEEDPNHINMKLQMAKDASRSDNSVDISRELHRLSSETEHFKKMGETARSEVLRVISEIQQTKTRIKTAEMRLVAARKMKEDARAAEAVALAEIKALSNGESSSGDILPKPEGVTLSYEEHSSLTSKARDAEKLSKRRVIDAMLQVDDANVSKMEILKRVEEATEEVKTTKKALEEALNRVEAANKGKLAMEEALRKWRSENAQKKRSVQNSTKFKNSCSSERCKASRMLDVNGLNLVSGESNPSPLLKPTLSIGQILSRKLLLPEEFEMAEKDNMKRKVSLGQILSKQNDGIPYSPNADKENGSKQQFTGKRKKFGFARFSQLLAKQNKKKKPTLNLR